MDCFSLRIFAHLTKRKDLENGDAFVSPIHRLLKSLEKKKEDWIAIQIRGVSCTEIVAKVLQFGARKAKGQHA